MTTRFDWSKQRLEDRRLLQLRYSEPHRCYHDIDHPENVFGYCLEIWEKISSMQMCPFEFFQTTCAWHDAIYVVGSTTNEEDSAQLYLRSSTAWIQNIRLRANVVAAIRASGDHWAPQNASLSQEQKAFLDADIYELGSEWELFNHNSTTVLREYCSKFTPQEVLQGRLGWLRKLDEKSHIFWLCGDREARARENISRGIAECEDQLKALNEQAESARTSKIVDTRDF